MVAVLIIRVWIPMSLAPGYDRNLARHYELNKVFSCRTHQENLPVWRLALTAVFLGLI
jgi:hypothetical protein